jgi:hypothetical protein
VNDTPEIPDSISSEMLDALLRNRNPLPISTVIPSLNLGGERGAPCDLQFSICQLIECSSSGTNIIQMMVAAIHLLTEVESHYDRHLAYASQGDSPYDDLSESELHGVNQMLRQQLLPLRASLRQLEENLTSIGYPYYDMRAFELTRSVFRGKKVELRDFRSHMLISDEVLESLQLEREPVTHYLDQTDASLTEQ